MSDLIPADDELTPIAPPDDELTPVAPDVAGVDAVPPPVASGLEPHEAQGGYSSSDGVDLADLPRNPRRLSDPYAGQRAQYEAEQRQREDLVRQAFEFTKDPGLTEGQVNLKIAQHFGVPEDVIQHNRAEWEKAYAQASGDPKAWIRDNPLAAQLVLDHPERADHIVNNKELNVVLQGWNKAADVFTDLTDNAFVDTALTLLSAGALGPQSDAPKYGSPEEAAAYQARADARPAERAKRDAPKPTDEVDDAEAARIREGGTAAVVAQRAKEGQQSLNLSKKYHQLLIARTMNRPTFWLEQDIHRMELDSAPKYLGETGALQVLSESVGNAMSTLDVAKTAIKKGGAGAAIGGAAGVTAGALVRSPALAAELGTAGASLLGKYGAGYGAAEGSFILESGSSYAEFMKLRTESGKPLTDEQARGGAIIAALLKTGIELAEFTVLLKAMGPAGEALKGGGLDAVKAALATNPGFRVTAVRALKAWAGEGLEEVAQDAVDQGAGYLLKSYQAGGLEKGPVFDPERLKENFIGGLEGGALFGVGGAAFTAAQHGIFQSKEARGALQAPELAKMAGDATVQSMSAEVAKLVKDKTSETGDDVTHVYLDPAGILRFFQNDEAKATEKVAELLGDTGPQQMAAGLIFGGNLEIPTERYFAKAGKEFADGTVDDMATQQGHGTVRQVKERAEANEKWAQDLSKEVAQSETLGRFAALEEQLTKSGTYSPSEAKAAMTPLRDAFINLAKKFGKPVEDLFRDVRVRIDDGTAVLELRRQQANASERLSKELHEGLSNEEKARRLYIDPVSGLRTRRAFDETARTPGRQVAVVTSPDIKAFNDHVEGGHDTSNDLLRAIGAAVGEVDPTAARSGTNFLFEVDSPEHLDQVLKRLRAALPDASLGLEGVAAPTVDEAFKALDAHVDEARRTAAVVDEKTKAEVKPAKKATLPARGETKFDLSKLKDLKVSAAKAKENLAGDFVVKAGTLLPEAFFREAYQDKQVPGVLSGTAWGLLPRKAHVASIDIKGLKAVNGPNGENKWVGDKLLKQFAQVLERNDASDFDFAHLSGDEYAAQHDDPEKLKAWLAHVNAELRKSPIKVEDKATGEFVEIEAEFHVGIGEKTYGAADRALNRTKAEAKRLRDEGKAAPDLAGGSGRDGAGGSGVPAGRGYERHGAPRQGFLQQRKEVVADPNRFFAVDKGFTDIAREGIDAVYRIGLLKTADKSTFLHESAHVFLDLFADLAERADAPKSATDDWATTLKWLGVDDRSGIKKDQHEKWAKAFETYVAEGKYPSDRLAGAFQLFRLWMMAVYKQMQNVGGAVSDDIRGVFDRLLATDAEIDASKARMGLKPLPREALGMNADEYAAHLDDALKATAHAAQAADFQIAKDQLRATEDWWKAAKRDAKAKAAEQYEALPARKAQLILSGKPAGDFLGLKEPLNRAVVEAMVGKEKAKKFKLAKDGVHPDDVVAAAEGLLGYATGKDMLEAVAKVPEKDVWVDVVAEDSMREQFPGVLDERTRLRDIVAQGLHGHATKEWVLKEFNALKSRTSVAVGEMPPVEVMKRSAEIAAGGRAAGRLNAREAQVAERTAANHAAEAAVRGNFSQAAIFKRQQLLNMYLFDALTKAKKEVEAFEEKGRQLAKTPARARLGKADPKYRDAVDVLLATFDVAEPQPVAQTLTLDAALQEVEKLMAEDQTPVAFDRVRLVERAGRRGLRTWRELPLEDVRHIMRALQNIEAAARNRSTVLLDEKRVDTEVVIEALQREAEQLQRRPDDPTPEAETFGQTWGRRWTAFDGALLKPETLGRFLSGAENTADFLKSMWFKAIVEPMQKAKVRELDLGREVLKPLVEKFDDIPNSSRQMEKIDGRALFPGHTNIEVPQRRFEILMMLLNMGNQSNIDRLTKGRGITEEEVRKAAVTVGITKEEYDWVQSVWDTAEKLKPLAFDLEEKHTGVRPEAITPRPLQTPHGTLAGGYFPAVYSPASQVGAIQQARLAEFKDPTTARPSTTHNYLISRVEDFSDVISLSPASINRHFALVIHDIAFREAVQTVGGLLSKDEVRTTMRERVGDGRGKQLLQWVGDVAQMRGMEGMDKSGGLMRLATWMRGNIVTSVLGYKIPNALEDFTTNLTSAIPASDLKPQHLAAGVAEFAQGGRALALEKSGELRSRQKQVQRELAKQVKDLTAAGVSKLLNNGPVGWYKEHAFAFAEAVEYATATPIWLGAYRQALGEGQVDADAVRFADATVRQVLVSHNPVDLSALMRDKGPIGYLTMFFGAFNHFYNQFRTLGHDLAEADTLKTRAVKAGKMLGLATGIFLVGSLARGKGPEKDEPYFQWVLRKMFLDGLLQMLPVVNVGARAADSALTGKHMPSRNNSLFGMTENIGGSLLKLADPDTSDAKRVKEFLNVLGPTTGIPTAGPLQALDPLLKYALGDE